MKHTLIQILVWVNIAMLIYFVVLNIAYTWLLVLGWLEGSRYVARRRFADLDDMRASELTTPMSILVPAYNEAPVIVESVRALLAADYPLHEVIVVNDGSRDETLEVLRQAFALVPVVRVPQTNLPTSPVQQVFACPFDDRLVVIDKVNGGKADAINVALNHARYPLFCTIDSDTIIDDDALIRLVRPFQDEPETVACGGVVRIANGSTVADGRVVDVRTPTGMLENVQIVEYLRAFLAGRAGWARVGALMVISGAFGVFRREMVVAAGGYDTTTVGEDAELVVRLHRYCRDNDIPYKIQFVSDPVCWTQAPSSSEFLAKQRDRWHRGLVELLWKHRGMMFRRRYGLLGNVAMPYHVVFEGIGPIAEMVGYACTVLAVVLGVIDTRIAIALLVMSLTYGLVLSFGALLIEDRAYRRYRSWRCVARMIVAAFIENFGYRQWSSFVRAKSFITLLRNSGWGEMARTNFNHRGRVHRGPRMVRIGIKTALACVVVWGVAIGLEVQRGNNAHAALAQWEAADVAPATWPAVPATIPAATITREGLRLPARATSTALQVATPRGFEDRFWPGVNLGSTTPGHLPGEVAITRADADRWLAKMGSMGVRVLRIYTILPPDFYDALRAYNLAHPRHPVYLIHGVWIPEEDVLAHHDYYRPQVVAEFRAELDRAVDVVHGRARIARRPGHAHGVYRSDVSPWVVAWSPGVEWNPQATIDSDAINAGVPAYRGRYVTTRGTPTPTESWIASMLDHLAAREARYGWSRPITFTNWLTTDALRHPEEPDAAKEDGVSVDPMNVTATRAWPAGFFASYHVYPYYPDFLRWSPTYAAYVRPDGAKDPYAGYLHALRAHHADQAVMVTEFGVPSGPGIAHLGPRGRNQGDHSEADAMRINADMLSAIHQEGFAGGIVFAWADEWFKFTWNTSEWEIPGILHGDRARQQLWRNALTNEEQFGIISQDASPIEAVLLDGHPDRWATSGHRALHRSDDGPVRAVDAYVDEEYLTLRIETDDAARWRDDTVRVGLDIVAGDNGGIPGTDGVMPGADVVLELGAGTRARIERAAWLDPLASQFGTTPHGFGYIPVRASDLRPGSGAWRRPTLILNKPYRVPGLGIDSPVELRDVSNLRWGTANPSAPDGDVRTMVAAHDTTIEVRLPWGLLGYADPSRHSVLVPHHDTRDRDGVFGTARGGPVKLTVVSDGQAVPTRDVVWEEWNQVSAHERVKAGVGVLVGAFRDTWRGGPVAAPQARQGGKNPVVSSPPVSRR